MSVGEVRIDEGGEKETALFNEIKILLLPISQL